MGTEAVWYLTESARLEVRDLNLHPGSASSQLCDLNRPEHQSPHLENWGNNTYCSKLLKY